MLENLFLKRNLSLIDVPERHAYHYHSRLTENPANKTFLVKAAWPYFY